MAGQVGAGLIQGQQLGLGEVPPVGQGGVQRRPGVSLGEEEPVPSLQLGLGRINPHMFEVQHAEDLRNGEAGAVMSRAQRADAADGIQPDIPRGLFQIHVIHSRLSNVVSL